MEDDQAVSQLHLACIPPSFGYSRSKGNQVFPPYYYPGCPGYIYDPLAKLTLRNDSFEMECSVDEPGRFVLHPKGIPLTKQYKEYELKARWKEEKYEGEPVQPVSTEFALGACSPHFNSAILQPQYDPSVHSRARDLSSKRAKPPNSKPLLLVFLTIDSFSRRHFYRKLTETVRTLSSLNGAGKYTVFDFKLHNIIGTHSPENMIPVFTNRSVEYRKRVRDEDCMGKEALWHLAKDWGFATMLGFEYCGSNFVNYMGREVGVDHHVSTFYCAAQSFMDISMAQASNRQRCIGPHMSHYYLLNYTHSLPSLYPDISHFSYIHLEAAHESTGQHGQTLDPDLSSFLQTYTSQYQSTHDIALFLQGDHGMAYGDWHKDLDAEQEYKLPALFLVMSTRLLDRVEYSYDTLWHNSYRLVSKRDLRATVLALIGEQYETKFPVHREKYLSDAVILYREKVKDSRVCLNAHIRPWLCSCLTDMAEIDFRMVHSWGRGATEPLLIAIALEALAIINSNVYTTKGIYPGVVCQRLSLEGVNRAFGYTVGNKVEEIRVEFGVNQADKARIETRAIVASDLTLEVMERSGEWNTLEPITYRGFQVYFRVVDVTRKDSYSGPCEDLTRSLGLDSEFCLCSDLSSLPPRLPLL